jgi:hypothetical protein
MRNARPSSINVAPRRMAAVIVTDGVGGISFSPGSVNGFSAVAIGGLGLITATFLGPADRIVGVATAHIVSVPGGALVLPVASNLTCQIFIRDVAGALVDLTATLVTVNVHIDVIP